MHDEFEEKLDDIDDLSFTYAMKLAAHFARRLAELPITANSSGPDALRAFANSIEDVDKREFGLMLGPRRN